MVQAASSIGEVAINLLTPATPFCCRKGPSLHEVAIPHRHTTLEDIYRRAGFYLGEHSLYTSCG